jgi:CBS domain-containing protein
VKVREVMSQNPACCTPGDSAQTFASIMRDRDVGAVPVVADQQSRRLIGMITDRDFCCSVVADGLDPKKTTIEQFISMNPISCRDGENIEKCERLMQDHQVRRIPVVDSEDKVIGIVSQADLALHDRPDRVSKTVAEISKSDRRPSIAA